MPAAARRCGNGGYLARVRSRTALCSLGVAAALSLAPRSAPPSSPATAASDRSFAAALLLTALGSTPTFSRHRNPSPLVLTIAAGLWIYVLTFVVGASSHAQARRDAVGDHGHGGSDQGLGGERSALVWFGLAVLIAAQVRDVVRVQAGRRSAGPAA